MGPTEAILQYLMEVLIFAGGVGVGWILRQRRLNKDAERNAQPEPVRLEFPGEHDDT